MIVPSGNRKIQVNQGGFKYADFGVLDTKLAIAPGSSMGVPTEQPMPDPNMFSQVSDAMNDSQSPQLNQNQDGANINPFGGTTQEKVINAIVEILRNQGLVSQDFVPAIKQFNAPGDSFELRIIRAPTGTGKVVTKQ